MPDAALDATAEALARQLLTRFPADRARTRADLAGLPAPVARLLDARLDARVAQAAAPPDTPWVDADAPALRDAVRAWREAARAAARVPATAWAESVEWASRLALAHLVRPAETAATYVFAQDEPLPAPLAMRRLRAFAPYPYLPEIAGRYVDRKGLSQIDRDGLERLLRRIDQRMVSAFGVDDWMALLEPLFSLVGPLQSPSGTVPAALLRTTFEAKGAETLADAVRGAGDLSPDALRQRLADAVPEAPEPEVPAARAPADALAADAPAAPDEPAPAVPASEPPPDEPEDIPSTALADKVPAVDPPATSAPPAADDPPATPAPPPEAAAPAAPSAPEPDEEPLWRRIARQQGTDLDEQPAPDAPDETPLWKRYAQPDDADAPLAAAAASPSVGTPLAALEQRVLGDGAHERRAWFVEELFGGSDHAYRQTLADLDDARSWTEATEIIARDVFRKHRVNIYSEPAVVFTDAVEAQVQRR